MRNWCNGKLLGRSSLRMGWAAQRADDGKVKVFRNVDDAGQKGFLPFALE